MTQPSLLVIGAGIAGLSAGCYGQMNGFETRLLEMHTQPGGLCTSWRRKGYIFDGCIHWLVGSGPGSNFYQVWRELGALQERGIVDHEEFMRVEGPGGRELIVYTDVDRFAAHLKEISPADSRLIDEFASAIRLFSRFDQPLETPPELAGPLDSLKTLWQMLPFAPGLLRYSKLPLPDFAARFRSPFLRETLPLVFDLPDFPTIAAMMTLGYLHKRTAGYPIGGSLAFSQAIARRYEQLGGTIQYKAKVRQILVQDDRAVGVRLDDGSEQYADVIVSAADGHATLFEMLDGRYLPDKVRRYYQEMPLFPSLVQVSLGLRRDLSSTPHSIVFRLDDPILIGRQPKRQMAFRHFCYDPTMAPRNHSTIQVLFEADYHEWKEIAGDREAYEAEKERIAREVIARLDERFPGLSEEVEVTDVATPLTFERYTGNWQGSFEGWLITTQNIGLASKGMDKTLPGLENFYMIGQWVYPGGGLPPAALSGRALLQILCHKLQRPFTTSLP